MGEIAIYWGSGSPFCWQALLALEAKGLEYVSHRLELKGGKHRTPEFLELNPRGTVPIVVDGTTVVCESLAILAYLDRAYPDPPLFGRTAAEAAGIWQSVELLRSSFQECAGAVIRPVFRNKVEGNERAIRDAVQAAHKELADLDVKLLGQRWLCGDRVSAADLVLIPTLQRLLRAAAKDNAASLDLGLLPLQEPYPQLAAWVERAEALPGYERAYPPHWR
jgi:glutathione S-transferase